MTIRQLVEGIDLVKQSPGFVNIKALAEFFEIGWNHWEGKDTSRLKRYFTKPILQRSGEHSTWMVGESAYFLDGEFVMYSYQKERPGYEFFTFVSVESEQKVLDFVLSFMNRIEPSSAELLVLDTEVPDKYQVDLNHQIPGFRAWYKGDLVIIDQKSFPNPHIVVIDYENSLLKVHVKDLWFDYNTI